jgi:hypothetical protein
MLDNQSQAGRRREIHRLDFFRPDQIVFLVTHQPAADEQLPDVELREWVAKLSAQISQNEELSNRPARDFVAELCEQLNDDERLPEKQLNEWTEHLKGQLGAQGWDLVNPQPRSYSFPPVSSDEIEGVPSEDPQELFPSAFSIIVCNVKRVGNSNNAGTANNINLMETDGDDKDEPDDTNAGRVRTKRRLFNLISILDQQGIRENMTSAGLTVQAVFPNWVASSGKSDSGGTGGPGGKPVPYTDTDIAGQIPYYFKDLVDKLKNEGEYKDAEGTNLYGEGEGVDVVILDTSPSSDDLVLAYKELVLRKEKGKEHPIVRDLLETDGLLNLYPATYEERRRMGNTSLNRHGYKMTDHGLFIAGIINSIVPKATIHLIEVLNQFGVGDIETIARGFAKAYAIYRRNKRHLLVNCSLCVDLPDLQDAFAYRETDEESIEPIEREFEKALRKKMKQDLEQLKKPDTELKDMQDDLRGVIGLRVMCERLGKVGRQVVAAAGNDSKKKEGGQRNAQAARYPAAFSKVIGVGALNNKSEPSSYSNLADKPAQTGIMALGGEPGAGNGVLGIYLGEFPSDNPEVGHMAETDAGQTGNEHGWAQVVSNNKNGWARWAGTSFATPILTATIASVLSGSQTPNTTQRALSMLYDEHVILEALTPETEDGMPLSVTQGVKPPP